MVLENWNSGKLEMVALGEIFVAVIGGLVNPISTLPDSGGHAIHQGHHAGRIGPRQA